MNDNPIIDNDKMTIAIPQSVAILRLEIARVDRLLMELYTLKRRLSIVLGDESNVSVSPLESLTDSEILIMNELKGGYTTEEIGKTLALSPATVRNKLTSIYSKLKVSNAIQAINVYNSFFGS